MATGDFFSDIRDLRERARQHMEQGGWSHPAIRRKSGRW